MPDLSEEITKVTPMPQPEATPPTAPPRTDPRAKGGATSEGKIAIFFGVAAIVIPNLSMLFAALAERFPAAGWIAVGASFLASVVGILKVVAPYVSGRNDLKVKMVQAEAMEKMSTADVAQALFSASRPK